VASCEQYATCGSHFVNDMAGCGRAEDASLSDDQLLHSVCSSDLCNKLYNLRIVVSAITTDHQERTLNAFWDGKKDRCDEGFAVVGLLENRDLLP
jgi:hypothetical protein